jgi:uncharacterized protein (DUF433 family)
MKTQTVQIVDRGRGPQLSTCRITVQDVVPYLEQNLTHEQIREIMPVLSDEDIQAIEEYVREHNDEVMARDRRIRERAAKRRMAPEVEESERQSRRDRLDAERQRIRARKQERNGDSAVG